MNPDDVLAEWERLAQEATKGPWVTGATPRLGETYFGTKVDPDDPTEPGVLLGSVGTEPDAAFIAAARTAWPAATAALYAVLDLHRQDLANGSNWCRRCGEVWPCATTQAVTDAIGGQE